MKRQLLAFVRANGMLKSADRLMLLRSRLRSRAGNRAFARAHPGFTAPPADLSFDAYHHVDWAAYHHVGRQHAQAFAQVIKSNVEGPRLAVLEWGCGPGRLIRHMPECLPGFELKLTGADYNPRSIEWCTRNIPGIEFTVNQFEPPLPFSSASFDVTYNFSVFTHLSKVAQLAWAAELLRVLKPGGLLVCSTHGDLYSRRLAKAEEALRYNKGELVVQGGYAEGKKWFLALHPPKYVFETLLAGFTDIQAITLPAEAGIGQDLWSARKPI